MDLLQKQQLFAREYSQLFDDLYRHVRFRITQKQAAEDIVSETCLKAYGALDKFDPDQGNIRQWLFGFAKNEILMFWRKTKITIDIEQWVEPLEPGKVRQFFEHLDERLLVERILGSLDPQVRLLLTLKLEQGWSFEELAEVAGKEPATIRKFFSRLYQHLRIQFKQTDRE